MKEIKIEDLRKLAQQRKNAINNSNMTLRELLRKEAIKRFLREVIVTFNDYEVPVFVQYGDGRWTINGVTAKEQFLNLSITRKDFANVLADIPELEDCTDDFPQTDKLPFLVIAIKLVK